MIKKVLIIFSVIVLSVLITGCASQQNKSAVILRPKDVDYITPREIPQKSYDGVVDHANPSFIKIFPHFHRSNYSKKRGPITWFSEGIGAKVPAVQEGVILEAINTETDLIVFIGNVDEPIFEKYFNTLTENGYTFEGSTTWDNMNLFNEKYAINLRFCQDGQNVMTVRVRTHSPQEAEIARKELIKKGIIFVPPSDSQENNEKKFFWQKWFS